MPNKLFYRIKNKRKKQTTADEKEKKMFVIVRRHDEAIYPSEKYNNPTWDCLVGEDSLI